MTGNRSNYTSCLTRCCWAAPKLRQPIRLPSLGPETCNLWYNLVISSFLWTRLLSCAGFYSNFHFLNYLLGFRPIWTLVSLFKQGNLQWYCSISWCSSKSSVVPVSRCLSCYLRLAVAFWSYERKSPCKGDLPPVWVCEWGLESRKRIGDFVTLVCFDVLCWRVGNLVS